MLGALKLLMVSALIIQSLFSRRAFWEFPLMEGQIDSDEIVITAVLCNEHQIAKEGRAATSWPRRACAVTPARGRANSPIRPCQITHHACLSFVSTMLLLPVSICFLSGWWLMGSSEEYHVSVFCTPVLLSVSPVQAQFPPHLRLPRTEVRLPQKR